METPLTALLSVAEINKPSIATRRHLTLLQLSQSKPPDILLSIEFVDR